MRPRIIGLHGPYSCGKDTLGAALARNVPDAIILKFADPLYAMAKVIDPEFRPSMPHSAKMENVLGQERLGTRRNFLEKLGTDFAREMIHPDFWVDIFGQRALEHLLTKPYGKVICTDVRAPNEAKWILDNGGVVIQIVPDWIRPASEVPSHKITKPLPDELISYDLYSKFGCVKDSLDSLHALILRDIK